MVAEIYLRLILIVKKFSIILKITTCADINQESADKSAKEYNVKVQTVNELMANKEIDLILNLTTPSSHKDIIIKSLISGEALFFRKTTCNEF